MGEYETLKLKYPQLTKLTIFKSIQYFQLEEANASLRYFRADNEDSNINIPPRRAHLDLVKEAKLVTLPEFYKDGPITYDLLSIFMILIERN